MQGLASLSQLRALVALGSEEGSKGQQQSDLASGAAQGEVHWRAVLSRPDAPWRLEVWGYVCEDKSSAGCYTFHF